VNRRSETPSEVVSEVKRIGSLPFGMPKGAPAATYVSGTTPPQVGEHPSLLPQ
jgi:hypothetical protein